MIQGSREQLKSSKNKDFSCHRGLVMIQDLDQTRGRFNCLIWVNLFNLLVSVPAYVKQDL